jgi:pyrimidine operon attenuation protein / uracil phosphoribosyltransferase
METTVEKVKIISAGAINAMLRRMAYEIYERNFAAEHILIAGIGMRGGYVADQLEAQLKEISNLKLSRADFVKSDDGLGWLVVPVLGTAQDVTLLIVDDVLYSGSTLVQAMVLAAPLAPAKIQTAVLIDRGHHRFPVQGNFVGMEIASSLKQYVSVEIDAAAQRAEAYIF